MEGERISSGFLAKLFPELAPTHTPPVKSESTPRLVNPTARANESHSQQPAPPPKQPVEEPASSTATVGDLLQNFDN